MNATDILKDEHRTILAVLNCLTVAADQAEQGARLDAESLGEMLEFFEGFADRCHHAKEEEHFFPLAHQRGVGCAPASLDSLRTEHETGRGYIRALHEDLAAAARGDGPARARFLQHARQYVTLLTHHMGKEDHCLFPNADARLTAADQEALAQAFEDAQHQERGTGTYQHLRTLADEICTRWHVPIPEPCTALSASAHS